MANIYQEITDSVGKTPLLKLQRYMDANACKADIRIQAVPLKTALRSA